MTNAHQTPDHVGRLHGKRAIITGAGSVGPGWGNGRATAVRFAQEGAVVYAIDRNLDAMTETLERATQQGLHMHPMCCDVTDSTAVRRLIDEIHQREGRIDVLVNNVGAPSPGGPVALSDAQWHRQLELNLTSVFLMCKAVLPLMVAQAGGAIVNIASTSGISFTGAPQIGYACAKAAVIQYSKVAGVEYARHGIRINSILPGQLHTPLVDAFLAKQQTKGEVEELLRTRQSRIPLPFMGDGMDTAHAALFLASDEARFITATQLIVDGGMTARCD